MKLRSIIPSIFLSLWLLCLATGIRREGKRLATDLEAKLEVELQELLHVMLHVDEESDPKATAAGGGEENVESTEEELMAVLQHYLQVMDKGNTPKHDKKYRDGLTMEDGSEGRVEGTYIQEDRHGMYFLSESEENGKNKLLITTVEGENLVYVLQLRSELTFISVANQTLLFFHSEEEGDEIYRVTPSHLFIVLNAVQENTDFEINLLRAHLPRVSEEEGVQCLDHILDFPEQIQMLIDTAKTMIGEGMSGEHNPALRVLFAHVLSLEHTLWKKNTKSGIQSYRNGEFVSQLAASTVTPQEAFIQGTERCSTFPTTCPAGRCPFEQPSNRCFGMCGRQCSCASFLCGDCCTHRGCIQHDDCCTRRGFVARLRCLAPVGFTCSGFRCSL